MTFLEAIPLSEVERRALLWVASRDWHLTSDDPEAEAEIRQLGATARRPGWGPLDRLRWKGHVALRTNNDWVLTDFGRLVVIEMIQEKERS